MSVVALDFGDVDNTLYTAAAKGTDRIVKISLEGEPPSPRAAAALYAAAVKPLSPDLVLIGVQAHDELDGGLSPFLAAALGLPYVGVICGVRPGAEPGTVSVCKEFPGAVMARMNVKLPALLGVVGAEQPPRYVPVAKIRAAMKSAQFEEQAAVAPGPTPPVSICRLEPPASAVHAEMLTGSEDEVAAGRRNSCPERTVEMSTLDVLVVAEIQRETLGDVTFELLAAARELASATGGEVVALLLSAEGNRYAAALGAADRIVLIDDPLLAAYAPEPFVTALQEVVTAEQPGAVLIGATSIGWIWPRCFRPGSTCRWSPAARQSRTKANGFASPHPSAAGR